MTDIYSSVRTNRAYPPGDSEFSEARDLRVTGIPNEFDNLYSVVERNADLVTQLIDRLRPITQDRPEPGHSDGHDVPSKYSSSNFAHNINSQATIIAAQNHRLMELLDALDL